MREAASVLGLCLVLGACADAPADAGATADPTADTADTVAADAAAAEAVLDDFFAAMKVWDYDALRATVTPDFELVEDTVIMGMDDFVAFIEPFQAQGASMTWRLSEHNTEVAGDVAWTRYVNRAVMTMDGQETRFHWLESAVLTRQPDGSWKIDRLQSNPVSIEGAIAEGG